MFKVTEAAIESGGNGLENTYLSCNFWFFYGWRRVKITLLEGPVRRLSNT
jgi:hypothetical protein